MPKQKTVLSLCDETGIASDPWRDHFDVITVDILNGKDVVLGELEQTLMGKSPDDVVVVLAQPPCTHFASSGARWWKAKGDEALKEGLQVADACMRYIALCQPEVWILENPVGRLTRYLGKPRYFEPYEFAMYADDPESDAYTKKTGLWGNYTTPVKWPWKGNIDRKKIHHASPGPNRARIRSVAPQGLWCALYEANIDRVLSKAFDI